MTAELRFDGRVALVTGAGRGMGRSHARLLARRGAKVVVNDLGEHSSAAGAGPAAEVAAEIESDGGVAVACHADISTEQGARDLIAAAIERFGSIDIVVNNAGTMKLAPILELSAELFDRTMRVNAYGPYYLTRAAWPSFLRQGRGRVVMIGSAAGVV
jgi:NAD(P)-dependent dehydrogenase (short-subunit alcohol dehydrogenase family)